MITLINPPNPPRAVSNKDTMGGFGQTYPADIRHSLPPIDIPYAAAVLRHKGIAVRVMECLGSGWDIADLVIHLQSKEQGLVALRTSTPTFEWDLKVAQIIKRTTGASMVLFGPHVTYFPEAAVQSPFVDAVVLGEPEAVLPEILDRGTFEGCPGVWYKSGQEIIRQGEKPLTDNLDSLPFPAWDLMPYEAYDLGGLMNHLRPVVTALTSRGCPHGCSYCPYPVTQGRRLRVRSAGNVADELEWLARDLGVKAVLLRDPEFTHQRSRVVEICREVLRREITVAWRCENRIEDLDEELIELMAKAGCIGVNVGIESADEDVLRFVKRKAVPFDKAKALVDCCRSHGLKVFCFFMLGLPGETKASAIRTIDYATRLDPTFIQFTVSTPYPGTELRAWAEERGFIEEGGLNGYTGYHAAMRNEHLSVEEISQLQWLAYESWEMKWQRMAVRILGNARRAVSELERWFKLRRKRSEMIKR